MQSCVKDMIHMPSWSNMVLKGISQLHINNVLCDTHILGADGLWLTAHSQLLAAISPCLKSALLTQYQSCQKVIKLEGISSGTWIEVLTFIYTGELSKAKSNHLLEAARCLQIDALVELLSPATDECEKNGIGAGLPLDNRTSNDLEHSMEIVPQPNYRSEDIPHCVNGNTVVFSKSIYSNIGSQSDDSNNLLTDTVSSANQGTKRGKSSFDRRKQSFDLGDSAPYAQNDQNIVFMPVWSDTSQMSHTLVSVEHSDNTPFNKSHQQQLLPDTFNLNIPVVQDQARIENPTKEIVFQQTECKNAQESRLIQTIRGVLNERTPLNESNLVRNNSSFSADSSYTVLNLSRNEDKSVFSSSADDLNPLKSGESMQIDSVPFAKYCYTFKPFRSNTVSTFQSADTNISKLNQSESHSSNIQNGISSEIENNSIAMQTEALKSNDQVQVKSITNIHLQDSKNSQGNEFIEEAIPEAEIASSINDLSCNEIFEQVDMNLINIECRNFGTSERAYVTNAGPNKASKRETVVQNNSNEMRECEILENIENFENSVTERNENGFECEHCVHVYKSRASFRKHMKLKHSDKVLKPLCRTTERLWAQVKCNVVKDRFGFHCNYCNYVSPAAKEFSRHNIEVHNVQTPFQCSLCEKLFEGSEKLIRHSVIHDSSSHVCNECGLGFKRKSGLYYHIKYKHSNVRSYSCSLCDKTFVEKSKLRNHMKSHSETKEHECLKCRKMFKTKSSLFKHQRTHDDLTPPSVHECAACQKRFKNASNLNKHKILHSGDMNFMCEFCNKRFSRADNLKSHIQRVHKKS